MQCQGGKKFKRIQDFPGFMAQFQVLKCYHQLGASKVEKRDPHFEKLSKRSWNGLRNPPKSGPEGLNWTEKQAALLKVSDTETFPPPTVTG